MPGIFISYRREDSGGYAGRLYDRLQQRFPSDRLFMDIDTIKPGQDFVQVLETAIGACDVVLAIIGRYWLTITDESGHPRLEHPEDFVRLELASALARNIWIIPVLVGGAAVPRSTDLPDALKALVRRQAFEISDTRFHQDADRLIAEMGGALQGSKAQPAAAPLVQEPAAPAGPPSVVPRLSFEPELICIPAGEFLIGSAYQKDPEASPDEQPQHTLYLPDYYLSKTPVTNAQYAAFMKATGHPQPMGWTDREPPDGREDYPVVYVSWEEAMAYCRWLSRVTGKAYGLPSEAEWEKGARGRDGRIYPWGDQWASTRCNSGEGDRRAPTLVGSYPQGASPYGVLDMAGNVWEWTRSLDFKYPYDPEDGREDVYAKGETRVVRGGAFLNDRRIVRCAYRYWYAPNNRLRYLGFRLVALP
jgi:formylglycine-generating enzyme required for sulfatase activity